MEKNNNKFFGILVLLLVAGGTFFLISRGQMASQQPESEEINQMEAVDQDIMPPEEEMMAESDSEQEPAQTIVDIAVADDRFDTLVTALQEADLVETLSGQGPFTVFAPTDAAFDQLPDGTLESLLQDKEQLASVLTYHVVSGKVMSDQVTNLTSTKTLQGQELMIDTSNGVMVDGAQVVVTDIEASNGVIHVIDTVLLPE